jgi:glyoxylase-like metal-dependent hydrolase (beta-lactamase superfamily II)
MTANVKRELHDLGSGVFAYTQLPGSWGWSNAGLVSDGSESLLIDTLFDKRITRQMLETMRDATHAANRIGTVVNTHGNGDHCYGNGEVPGAEIIGTQGCLQDLLEAPASRNAMLLKAARIAESLGWAGRTIGRVLSSVGIDRVTHLLEAGPFAIPLFEDFDFKDNPPVPPTRIFSGELNLKVGDKDVQLIEVGPAHTLGDAVVYVPSTRTLFTGDILFKDAHPLIWQGPVANWIQACDTLCELDVEVVVPGHGPLTDLSGLKETKHYLELLTREVRQRFDAGLNEEETAHDLALNEFSHWIDPERIYVNVHTLYREFRGGDEENVDVLALFAGMAKLARHQRA